MDTRAAILDYFALASPSAGSMWTVADTFQHGQYLLTYASKITIAGERRRFRFLRHVSTPDGREWLDVIGGAEGSKAFRADRIRTVHRIMKTRENAG